MQHCLVTGHNYSDLQIPLDTPIPWFSGLLMRLPQCCWVCCRPAQLIKYLIAKLKEYASAAENVRQPGGVSYLVTPNVQLQLKVADNGNYYHKCLLKLLLQVVNFIIPVFIVGRSGEMPGALWRQGSSSMQIPTTRPRPPHQPHPWPRGEEAPRPVIHSSKSRSLLIACGCAQFRSRIPIGLRVYAKTVLSMLKTFMPICVLASWQLDGDADDDATSEKSIAKVESGKITRLRRQSLSALLRHLVIVIVVAVTAKLQN